MKIVLTAVALLLFAGIICGQTPREYKPRLPQPVPTGDIVEVTNFSVNPQTPLPSQSVTVRMTIKNVTSAVLNNVPWVLENSDGVLARGVQANVAAGSSFEVSANWIATSGSQLFTGNVDPDHTLKEILRARSNNSRRTVISVATPRLKTEQLDYQKAKFAGAQFLHNTEGSSLCSQIGVFDWKTATYREGLSRGGVTVYEDAEPKQPGIIFAIECPTTGGRAAPEAFKNFTLKNGWKVKRIEIKEMNRSHGDWRWDQPPPSEGSTNPFMKMRLYANSTGSVWIGVSITIEGPEGTDPYR